MVHITWPSGLGVMEFAFKPEREAQADVARWSAALEAKLRAIDEAAGVPQADSLSPVDVDPLMEDTVREEDVAEFIALGFSPETAREAASEKPKIENSGKKLQAGMRGMISRRMHAENQCARVLQGALIGWLVRWNKNIYSDAASEIQSHMRGHEARRHVSTIKTEDRAATQLQAVSRGMMSRRIHDKWQQDNENVAAAAIQSLLRMVECRQEVLTHVQSVEKRQIEGRQRRALKRCLELPIAKELGAGKLLRTWRLMLMSQWRSPIKLDATGASSEAMGPPRLIENAKVGATTRSSPKHFLVSVEAKANNKSRATNAATETPPSLDNVSSSIKAKCEASMPSNASPNSKATTSPKRKETTSLKRNLRDAAVTASNTPNGKVATSPKRTLVDAIAKNAPQATKTSPVMERSSHCS